MMKASTEGVSRPRLSVAMIVRDEEQILADSIQAIRAIADETVVLDTGSADQTAAIARRAGAVVGCGEWTDDFSAARNRCRELASGDWILWLDAGERLEPDAAAELRRFVDHQAQPGKAYMLWVEMPPREPDACREQVVQLRLVPNRPELRFEGRVRESLRPSIEAAGLEIDAAVGRILRHPRDHDPLRKSLRAQRNLRLAGLEAAESGGVPARLHLVVADARSSLGNRQKAQEAFLAAIEAAEHGSTEMLEAYYGLLTTGDGSAAEADDQLRTCLEALEVFPLDAQLLLAMGNYLQARGRADLATRSFKAAMQHGQVDLQTWHLVDLAEVAADYLNLSLQIQGQDDEACRVLEEGVQRNPDSIRLRRRLIALHVRHGRSEEALDLAARLPGRPDQRRSMADAIRGGCKAAEKDWTAALADLQAAYVAGCRDPLCLRWLSVTLLSSGQVEAARPVLAEWRRIDPANAEVQTCLAAIRQQPESRQQQADGAQHERDDSGRQIRVDTGGPVSRATPPASATVSRAPATDAAAPPET